MFSCGVVSRSRRLSLGVIGILVAVIGALLPLMPSHAVLPDCTADPVPNVDYSGCDLSYRSFMGANLTGAIFDGADISNTNFEDATLVINNFLKL